MFERVLLTGVVTDATGSFKFFLEKDIADKALLEHQEIKGKQLDSDKYENKLIAKKHLQQKN